MAPHDRPLRRVLTCGISRPSRLARVTQFWIAPVGRRGKPQHSAGRFEPVEIPELIDVGVKYRSLQSGCVGAKKLAMRRMSLAKFSSPL